MKVNKALVKHEFRTMKWMLLYFAVLSLGYIFMFNMKIDEGYLEMLNYGTKPNTSVISYELRRINEYMTIPFGVGILTMIVMQFKDSKSIEVGRFLKALPIKSEEYYLTKVISGILSYTIPFIFLVVGVLTIRGNNMEWINDIKNISVAADAFIKVDNIANTISTLLLIYLIITSTYVFLFMAQYLVANTVGGIVIGVLSWLSPLYILGSIVAIYGNHFNIIWILKGVGNKNLINLQPWLYHLNPLYKTIVPNISDSSDIYLGSLSIDGNIVSKIIICVAITIISIVISYFLAKKSRIENADMMITFKLAKKIFITGVTVCSTLLGGLSLILFLNGYTQIGFTVLHLVMLASGLIGFLISRKIANIGVK